jgi:3-oxoacyl-[acyl-carrier protein] reductase
MTLKPLEGKVAWITGSSRGIGRVTAAHLASLGARVALHGISQSSPKKFDLAPSMDALAQEIAEEHGVEAMAVCGDLTDEAVVHEATQQIRNRFGQIDILVNCAGGDIGAQGVKAPNAGKPRGNDAIHISLEDINTILGRNLMTCILCCREVVPEMMERKSGWVVNVGSIAGLTGNQTEAIYSTSKAAVHEYTRCLAAMLRPYNVYANAVAPGPTVTPRFLASRPLEDDMNVTGGTLERYGWPIEVARAIAYLVTGDPFMTGQVLRVDGGRQLWPA